MVAVNTAMIRRLIAATLSFAVSGAGAEETRYAPWGGDADQVQELVDALRRLVDEAEQARAADPRFLSDLRALANRHDRHWQTRLLSEDFRDGDFTRNPAWVRHSGKFEVTFSGLLSRAVAGGGDNDRGSLPSTSSKTFWSSRTRTNAAAKYRRRPASPRSARRWRSPTPFP